MGSRQVVLPEGVRRAAIRRWSDRRWRGVRQWRAQPLGWPGRQVALAMVIVYMEAFETSMQPLRPARIGVAVRNKGAVLQRDGLGHGAIRPKLTPDYGEGSQVVQLTVPSR